MHRSAQMSSGFSPGWDELIPGMVWAQAALQHSNTGKHRATGVWEAPWGWQGWTWQPGTSHHTIRDQGSPSPSTRDRDGHCRGWNGVCPSSVLACCFNPLSTCCIFSQPWQPLYSMQSCLQLAKIFFSHCFCTLSAFFNNADKIPGWRQSVAGRNGSKQSKATSQPCIFSRRQ